MYRKVSFIIPSYNSVKTLAKTIESLLRQSDEDVEIIIVDSSDDEMAQKYISIVSSDRVKVIVLKKKTSPAQGRNIGARAACGELLCFIDSDVVLADDWLKQVLAAYAQGCLIGGGCVDIDPSQAGSSLAWAQLFLQFNESLPGGQRRKIGLLPACNMFCQKKLFDEVGGFPDMRASEDVVLCLKLQKISSLWLIPQARAYHIFRDSKQAYARNQMMLGRYILIYRRKFGGNWFYQGLWPLVFLPAFAAIKFFRIVSRIQKNTLAYQKMFMRVLPLFLLGFLFWCQGFVLAVFNDKDSR